ncbi:MAG TPA: MFS transporter [Steroidobacteraceae bacterium]|nr:MFS transporter [Steroidobacteraceae bacterium]
MRGRAHEGSAESLLAAVSLIVLADAINGALASVTQPYLMGGLSVSADGVAQIGVIYFIGKLLGFLFADHVRNRWGDRAALFGGGTLLAVTDIAAGLLHSYPVFFLSHGIQGATGGIVIAVGQAALLKSFALRRQPLVQAVFALAAVVVPAMLIPAFLGLTAEGIGWQWAVLTAAGLAVCGTVLLRGARTSRGGRSKGAPFLTARTLFLAVAVSCGVFVLQRGERYDWFGSLGIAECVTACSAALAVFLVLESGASRTLFRYHPFRLADFSFGTFVGVVAGIALFGSSAVITLIPADVLGYPTSQTGLLLAPSALCAIPVMFGVAWCVTRTRVPMFAFVGVGLVLFASAMWLTGALPPDVSFGALALRISLRGLAIGGLFLPLALITLLPLPPQDACVACGLFNFARQLGGLIGIAWIQTLAHRLDARASTVLVGHLSAGSPHLSSYLAQAREAITAGGSAVAQGAGALVMAVQAFDRQTLALAADGCCQAVTVFFAVAVPIVIVMRVLTSKLLAAKATDIATEENQDE